MPSIDLSKYVLTLNEEFNTLNIGRTGSGAQWTPHLWNGAKFSDAAFVDNLSAPGSNTFAVKDGALEITARETAHGWTGGLIASVDPLGNGFTQTYGYFEIRADLPHAADAWPTFWLLGTETLKGGPVREIDIMETQSDQATGLKTLLGNGRQLPLDVLVRVQSGDDHSEAVRRPGTLTSVSNFHHSTIL
jgi:beta-glucanase (GH16 family)